MSLYDTPKSNPKRRPSLRGAVMLDITHGEPRARAWPRPRGKGGTEEQKQQREWFRQASWAIKYMAPEMVKDVMVARQGKPLLPRDMLMMMLSGRLATLTLPSGKRLVPLVAQNDVSESLDFISAVPGMILVRGTDQWESIPAPVPGNVWWWQPPNPSDWTFSSFDATQLAVAYDPLKGCAVDAGPPAAGGRARIAATLLQFPTLNFTVTMQMAWQNQNVAGAGCGLWIRNNSNGRLIMMTPVHTGEIWIGRWNSLASYNATTSFVNYATTNPPQFFRIRRVGTDMFFDLSCDGFMWWQMYSETVASFLGDTSLSVGFGGWTSRTTGGRVTFNIGQFAVEN
jgi:hypothetical protein